MNADYIETARLLARFKLEAGRELGVVVDLEAMVRDYLEAERTLAAVEQGAPSPKLLALAARLRERLLSPPLLPDDNELPARGGGVVRHPPSPLRSACGGTASNAWREGKPK
ncbi:MAG: hypothetical protein RBS40_06395 [Rhodocyclaceae bacterium]|jgi:hypothetical protein|nr:hypothetical protein [Rhodocyclaceae bacterium]